MNKIFISTIILLSLIAGTSFSAIASEHELATVLNTVDRGNISLKAAREQAKADCLELASDNTLGPTSVEYSPFFQKGVSGVATSELIVQQEFDFPSLYAARGKAISKEASAREAEVLSLRRDILFEASSLYIDMVALNQTLSILSNRLSVSDSLLVLFEKRLLLGDATALDVNRLKLDNIDIKTAIVQNRTDYSSLAASLTSLYGTVSLPGELMAKEFPFSTSSIDEKSLVEEYLNAEPEIKAALSAIDAASENLKAARQSWLPTLSAGYRRNTELGEAFNGIIVGASFPLFSSSKKVKAAQSRIRASQLALEDSRVKARNEAASAAAEFTRIREIIVLADTDILSKSLELNRKAVEAGQISSIDYCLETDNIYQRLMELIALQTKLQHTLALLHKNSL